MALVIAQAHYCAKVLIPGRVFKTKFFVGASIWGKHTHKFTYHRLITNHHLRTGEISNDSPLFFAFSTSEFLYQGFPFIIINECPYR